MTRHWLFVLACAGLLPFALVGAEQEKSNGIAKVETGLFKDAKGPRWTIQERMQFHKVPGVSVAVIRNRQVAWAKGYGVSEAGGSVPITITTLFQAASISKPIAALLAMFLINQGKLDPDEDVNKYLKRWKVPDNAFTRKKKVTIRELVSHSAGVTVHGFGGYQARRPTPTLPQILNGQKPANSPPITVDITPGEKARYSGGGYCILQMLMEDVTGQGFAELAQTTVLNPLLMKQSHYHFAKDGDAKQYAAGHTNKGAVIIGKRHNYPERAAAGLYTTPTDLAQYGIFLMNKGNVAGKQILPTKWATEVLRNQVPNDNVGFGIFLFDGGFSHNGSNAGFQCAALFFTDGNGVVVMGNSDGAGPLNEEIINSVRAVYGF